MRDFKVAMPTKFTTRHRALPGFSVPRWRWLKWALQRLGLLTTEFHYDTHLGVKVIVIQADCLREFLGKQIDEVRRVYNERITAIYIGRDHFQEFLHSLDSENSLTIMTCKMDLEMLIQSDKPFSTQAWGIKVHFIPWFEGVLAVPDTPAHPVQEPNDGMA